MSYKKLGFWPFDNITFPSVSDVTSIFKSKPAWDAKTKLSTQYALGDFTRTNVALSKPNLPDQEWVVGNLQEMAKTLESLSSYVGRFNIISAFRTSELQAKLGESGAPTATKKSFHEIGRAVDIYPTTMKLDDFFGKLLANEDIKAKFSEISIKPSQNAIHLAVNVPSDWRTPKVMGLTTSGTYASLSPGDILNYIRPYIPSADKALEEAKKIAASPIPWSLLLAAGAGYVGYTMLARRNKKINA